eukprot:242976-Prymnesium_polylepis.1
MPTLPGVEMMLPINSGSITSSCSSGGAPADADPSHVTLTVGGGAGGAGGAGEPMTEWERASQLEEVPRSEYAAPPPPPPLEPRSAAAPKSARACTRPAGASHDGGSQRQYARRADAAGARPTVPVTLMRPPCARARLRPRRCGGGCAQFLHGRGVQQ